MKSTMRLGKEARVLLIGTRGGKRRTVLRREGLLLKCLLRRCRYRDKKIRAAKRAARSELSVTKGEW